MNINGVWSLGVSKGIYFVERKLIKIIKKYTTNHKIPIAKFEEQQKLFKKLEILGIDFVYVRN